VAIEIELAALSSQPKAETETSKPRRAPLPANLPRVEIRHEPDSTSCACGCELKRIGEDVSEKLDYTPGVFTVERHVRGKWVCAKCETLIQAPVPAQIIDKGIPTATRRYLRARRPRDPALDVRSVDRRMRRAVAAVGRCAQEPDPHARGASR
jgi:hypothetical protein